LTEFATATISKPKGLERIEEMPNLTVEMLARGWTEARLMKILGGNWLRLLDKVWHDG
jgi:membrane dipeptidase